MNRNILNECTSVCYASSVLEPQERTTNLAEGKHKKPGGDLYIEQHPLGAHSKKSRRNHEYNRGGPEQIRVHHLCLVVLKEALQLASSGAIDVCMNGTSNRRGEVEDITAVVPVCLHLYGDAV